MGGRDRQRGLDRDQDQTREPHALKLPRIGKYSLISINSCDVDKIQRAFEEISKYVGTNMYGGVSHYSQRALNTRDHYHFDDEAQLDPSVSVTTNEDGLTNIKEIKASA